MDDDEILVSDTPGEATDAQSVYDKHRASLQIYLNSLPYPCETIEDMHGRFEDIVAKIFICAKAKNWLVLSTWDGLLQCWLVMRYPIYKSTRAKLVRLYYELCVLPGIEPRVIRSWADMLSRLIGNKPGFRRKLEVSDLQLSWKPLFRLLWKEISLKEHIYDSSRNLVNIILYIAEQCQRYYPASEIPEMLETFIPRITKETVLTMIPVLTSFLPPAQAHIYIPALFKIWEAFNSAIMDDRLLEMAGDLSEEHVAGNSKEDGTPWNDVGIWTQSQWNLLVGKGLGSMNVPIGSTKNASSTGQHADRMDKGETKIKKSINKINAFAKILVYSMAVDGEIRDSNAPTPRGGSDKLPMQAGYIAGSKAVESLEKIITSTESFFHPSNSGPWTTALTNLLQRLTAEFTKRLKEEELETCKTPATKRLTPAIKRAFVTILRTPALLAMFSKDPACMSFAQGSLRSLAMLEPDLIMPELLERAYGGLEVVNETHRTTAVLSMLSGIARPLVTEKIWLGGQKHVVPLLELCIPGIDLNDPVKTVCATMFIVAVVQHIKIGDLSMSLSGLALSGDEPPDGTMVNNEVEDRLPDGTEMGETPRLSREDEIALVRDSTAGFADWVTSLFRRVLALYENLPEEGGKKNTTGGKQEESVLRSIKTMMDVVCLHLSDNLFDLVLNLVYNYATTNAKSNSVRAFGQLVACLARVHPEETVKRFLPFCTAQIEEELRHGASSIRTTSSHAAAPSDTTLHWHISILRGCLGYGGPALLGYKKEILSLLALLVEHTKSERGYSGTGRLITRIINSLVSVYPLKSRFVNGDEWKDPAFKNNHTLYWGKLYESQEVVIDWHVPCDDEIQLCLNILDHVASPCLDKIEVLLDDTSTWDGIARNDFCRYLHACRAVWMGLSTIYMEQEKEVPNPCLTDIEIPALIVSHLNVSAGFALTDSKDPRYQKVVAHRHRFGELCEKAAFNLRGNTEGEDHIDAILGVTRSIETYLLDYGLNRNDYITLQKNYVQSRDLNRSWARQKDNSRIVCVKRAHVYHCSRVYMHALYRRRSGLDDRLITELVELSLSQYTRIRRQAQAVLHGVTGYFVRSSRYILPSLFDALVKGNDPDRMKGALYVLWNKGIAAYALADQGFYSRYLTSILECQHEEKPSIQKVVSSVAQECIAHLNEEAMHTDAYTLETPQVDAAFEALMGEFSESVIDRRLLHEALTKAQIRVTRRHQIHHNTVSSVMEIASRPTTHWRYIQMACRFLSSLLQRGVPVSPDVARFFVEQSTSPQPTIRTIVQKAIIKLLAFVKIRTYAKTSEELWFDEWRNPLQKDIVVGDPVKFLDDLQQPVCGSRGGMYVDKIRTGFLSWTGVIKGYQPVQEDTPPIQWESQSQASQQAIIQTVKSDNYIQSIASLWSQESTKGGNLELRSDNVTYIKSLAKIFEGEGLDDMLAAAELLLSDMDKYKQRAGAEILVGLLRGSKHWRSGSSEKLWTWTISRLDRILAQMKPETLAFWETVINYQLGDRDPRRNQVLVKWILSLPLEFNGESAFQMNKSLSLFSTLVESLGLFFNPRSDEYVKLLLDNANTGYAEIRQQICQCLFFFSKNRWQPWHLSTEEFLNACSISPDPLHLRDAWFMDRISDILDKLPRWREGRLSPPRVNQSEYDKVGLTLLQWIWESAHGSQACLAFPYAIPMMPEILRMSEFNDNPELQAYSSSVLYVLSAVSLSHDDIQAILENYVTAIKSSTSWRIRLHALPALVIFFYRNLLSISQDGVVKVMDVLLDCLADENVEVREMASKALSGVVRCSQRQSIIPLKNRFVAIIRKETLPSRRDPAYTESLRSLHSAILGICALIESLPYSVEPWVPPLTEVLAPHATDPPPISTTIRKCASEFKKTHQDTWHKDQLMFDEDQLQSLSTMLVGTSYYA